MLDGKWSNTSLNLQRAHISSRKIVPLLREKGVPQELDYLSIDLDPVDLWLFDAIIGSELKPRIVSVEYNANYPWGFPITVPDPAALPTSRLPSWDVHRSCFYGASAHALYYVARRHRYAPVALEPGFDIFFARADVASLLPPFDLAAHPKLVVPLHHAMARDATRQLIDVR